MSFSPNKSNKNENIKNMPLKETDSISYKNNQSIQKKNTIEYDNFFSKEIRRSSNDIKFDYNERNITKNRMSIDTIEKNNNEQSNNTLETINNKNFYNSYNSTNNDIPKLNLNRHSILSLDNAKSSLNNNTPKSLTNNIIPNHTKLITNYRNWKGNNYFLINANALEGPCQFRPTLLTWCAMTIPPLLFYIFNFDYFVDELSFIIPMIIAIIYLITCIFLIIASFIDPAIIRRFNLDIDNKNKDYINYNVINYKRNEAKIFQLGYIKNYKYCPSCAIIRPNRSTHCSDCNNCVERLDHHCPWIGNCVGKRNYKHFFIFLVLLNLLSILIIIFCIIHIVKKTRDNSKINKDLPEDEKIKHLTAFSFCDVIISLYLIIYIVIMMCFITGLIIYHTRLVLFNSTTKEETRYVFNIVQGNPYKRSICKNIRSVLCPTIKKYSILDILRGDIKEICDHKKYKPYSNNIPQVKYNEIENNNETNACLNVNDVLINNNYSNELKYNNINSEEAINYKENIGINEYKNNYNQIEEKNISHNYMDEKDYSNQKINNEYNNEARLMEPKNTDIKSNSYKKSKNNKLLQEYLKNFGTGISNNQNNNYTNNYYTSNRYFNNGINIKKNY